jgi:hypothetical protein
VSLQSTANIAHKIVWLAITSGPGAIVLYRHYRRRSTVVPPISLLRGGC